MKTYLAGVVVRTCIGLAVLVLSVAILFSACLFRAPNE